MSDETTVLYILGQKDLSYLALVQLVPFWQVWAEIECTMHVD